MANAAPTLDPSASPALTTLLENAAAPSGDTVGSLLGGAVDADGNPLGIAITALDTGIGTWQYSNDGGANWLTIDAAQINSTTNELALLLGATAMIRLLPFGELNGNATVTFRAWDGTGGSEGEYLVIAATGGTSAFSADIDTASVAATAVNDAPTFAVPNGTGKAAIAVGSARNPGYSVTVQPDGKILMAGYANNGRDNDFAVVRLNADGTLDTSFNGTGKATIAVGSSTDEGRSVTVQPDGKIVVAGSAKIGVNPDFAVVRLNADGTLDTSFNGTGKAAIAVGLSIDEGRSVTVQLDGKILVAGSTYNGNYNFGIVRLNADGTLDTGFNGTGKASIGVGSLHDGASSVAVQPDGKILLAGTMDNGSNTDFAIVRLNADGTLDTDFNGTGKVAIGLGSWYGYDGGSSVTVQSDGKILVAGSTQTGSNNEFGIVRLNANGTLDTSFNGTGKAAIAVGSSTDIGHSVTVQPDGKILVAGLAYDDDEQYCYFAIVRLNGDGTADTSFNGTGKATIGEGMLVDYGYSVTVQPDGKILVAGVTHGSTIDDFGIVRLNADGTLDTTFNGNPASTLGGAVSYTEGEAAIALDSAVAIHDIELAAANNYSGASVAVARNGGASSDDVFSARGNLSFSSGNAVLSGVTIGTVSNTGGTLILSFNGNATQARVNEALSSIGYANASDNPAASVQIDWTFSDGNTGAQGTGGALAAIGSTTVDITAVNDAPVLTGDLTATLQVGASYALTTSDLNFIDPDDMAAGVTFSVNTLSHGVIKVSGSSATSFTGAQLVAGVVSFEHDGVESTSASFKVSVEDGDEDGSTPAESSFNITVNDAPTGTVLIAGTALVGHTLTASNTLADANGMAGAIGYQWSAGGVDLDGETGDTLLLTSALLGQVISVTASYVDGGGTTEAVMGSMTGTVGSVVLPSAGGTTVTGTAGDDFLMDGNRVKSMIGATGDDTYLVSGRRVTITELPGEGSDTVLVQQTFTLFPNVESLTLAGARAINGKGNALDNVIAGNAASNRITGMGGADTLTGGAGADRFVYEQVEHSTAVRFDTILDFNALEGDRIDLRKIDANFNRSDNQKFVFIGSAQFSDFADGAGLLRFDPTTHMLEASVDSDFDAELAILLVGVSSLSASSIVL